MSVATLGSMRSGDVPDKRDTPANLIITYRRLSSQCLILSDYTKPGLHTLPALIIYMEAEFIVNVHDQINCYIMLGVIIRLALRMGFHRDATKVAGNISICQAEMRRRLWSLLFQIDHLSSFHIGLPALMPGIESDTNLPRNLRDEDFDDTSTELPPGRPDSELTPMSYTIGKCKIAAVFGQIAVHANRLSLPTYDEVLKLDESLKQAYSQIPTFFQMVPLELALMDSVELIIQRLSLAVLYHKSQCVLHRKYLMMERSNNLFAYSKTVGLNSSVQLLSLQSSIHDAVKPGGLLSREKWFVSSLSIHDFLLAATIVYLHLIRAIECSHKTSNSTLSQDNESMISLLERSHTCWKESQEELNEAKKATNVLGLMVGKIRAATARFNHTPQNGVQEVVGPDSFSGLSLDGMHRLFNFRQTLLLEEQVEYKNKRVCC